MRVASSSHAAWQSLLLRRRVIRSIRKAVVPGCAQVHHEQRFAALQHIERNRFKQQAHIESSELKVSARAEARSLVNVGQSVGAATRRVLRPTVPLVSSPAVAAPFVKRGTSFRSAAPHQACVVGYSGVSQFRSGPCRRLLPNPSIERTSPGKPGAASHLKR